MKVTIDFESVQKLCNGDCIEISGIVGKKKLEITFLIGSEPTFKSCMDQRFGWDIYRIKGVVSDIHSGTIFTSLEYYQDLTFSVNFNIKTDEIITILNETELCSARPGGSINDITSIEIDGDCAIKHVLFSDYCSKSSRVLQPLIFNSLEPKGSGSDDSVTVIESRQRIIFKHDHEETKENDSDSDIDFFESENLHSEFDYVKKALMSKNSIDNDEFKPRARADIKNKYTISYFDPDSVDCDQCDGSLNFDNIQPRHDYVDPVNEKINELKTNTKKIGNNIEITGKKIAEFRRPSATVTETKTRVKAPKMLKIPVSTMDGSYLKYNLTRDLSRASKIPVFQKSSSDKENVTSAKSVQPTLSKLHNHQTKSISNKKPPTNSQHRRHAHGSKK